MKIIPAEHKTSFFIFLAVVGTLLGVLGLDVVLNSIKEGDDRTKAQWQRLENDGIILDRAALTGKVKSYRFIGPNKAIKIYEIDAIYPGETAERKFYAQSIDGDLGIGETATIYGGDMMTAEKRLPKDNRGGSMYVWFAKRGASNP